MSGLSHLDADGRARMVDVGDKAVTKRTAVAVGVFATTAEVVSLVRADDLPKADVLATARLAGIGAAKRTSELIPLCHQIPLSSVSVDFALDETTITITATAKTRGTTGVEMEALTAVAVAGLTLHDMTKAVDPFSELGGIRLVEKTGGKADVGHAVRPATAAVVVVSTSAASGDRDDTTGPLLAEWLRERGITPDPVLIVADDAIAARLPLVLETAPALVITTGGTGVGRGDRTPEATRAVLDRELPGVAEAIRAEGAAATPTAALSRALVGTARGTLVINLPGSPGGVRDGLAVLDRLLTHLLDQIAGGGPHD